MASPNTFKQNIKEKARKAISRKFERMTLTEGDLDAAAANYDLSEYTAFFKDCREEGHPTERCGALWNRLKERGDVSTGGSTGGASGAGSGGTSGQQTTTQPPTPDPEAPEPASIDELEAELEAADDVYLITQPGCPSCQSAKEAISDWIEDGIVEVLDVQESDLGADIVMENGIGALPAFVLEEDGERITI